LQSKRLFSLVAKSSLKRSYRHRSKSNYVFKLPFGEEITSGTGGRNSAQGYGGQDSIRQKFTGYERDTETDLDFAQARYYGSAMGRFTSIDPYNIVTVAADQDELNLYLQHPQIWNRYTYVLNNPLRLVDPEGLNPEPVFDWNKLNADERRILENSRLLILPAGGAEAGTSQVISGRELFDHLAQNNPDALAGFLNQTAQLNAITFDVNGQTRTALSFVQSVESFAPDRIIANTDPQLKTLISTDKRFTKVQGHKGHPDSWKDNRPLKGNVQLSFSTNGKSADIDTDLGNIAVKSGWNIFKKVAGIIIHTGEVIQNRGPAVTDPYTVYNILIDRKIKVSYSLKTNK
jgi:RHS repeat-associated protein